MLFFLFVALCNGVLDSIQTRYDGLHTNLDLNEFLLDSNVKINSLDRSVPRLSKLVARKDLTQPWLLSRSRPFWSRIAQQAIYLNKQNAKYAQKLAFKLEIAKKLPYLKRLTNDCLNYPWHHTVGCEFKQVTRNIELICLIEGVEKLSIQDMLHYDRAHTKRIDFKYDLFCWIILAINYLEQCQLNLLIDEHDCSLSKIELLTKLVVEKINTTISAPPTDVNINYYHLSNLQPIYDHYFDVFKDRAMQILIGVLILMKNNYVEDDADEVATYRMFEAKLNLEKLLNYLLNDYVERTIANDIEFRVRSQHEQFQIVSELINAKIKTLRDKSAQLFLKHVHRLASKEKWSHENDFKVVGCI